jgi:hypothetical protein
MPFRDERVTEWGNGRKSADAILRAMAISADETDCWKITPDLYDKLAMFFIDPQHYSGFDWVRHPMIYGKRVVVSENL